MLLQVRCLHNLNVKIVTGYDTRKRPNKNSRFTNTNEKITRGKFVILKAEGVVAEDMFHRNNLVDPNKI